MQAKDLIVLGSSRLLGKLYCGDIDISGTASFTGNLSVSGKTTTNQLVITSTTDISGTSTPSNAPLAVGSLTGLHIEFDGDEIIAKNASATSTLNLNYNGGTVLLSGSTIKADGSTFTAPTINNTNLTSTNITSNSITNTGNITNSGNINNRNGVIETDEIQSNVWNIVSTQNLGGDFFVAPTIMITEGSTFYISSISNGVIAGYIVDSTNITSDAFAGHSWTSGSKIKITGKITQGSNSYILGTCDGTLTANMNSSSGRITFSITCKAATLPTVTGSYTISDGTVMMYSVGGNNKVGIYMTSYGIDHSEYNASNANKRNKYSYIDIFNGADGANPKVRIGKLGGLPAINSINPEGYGIYTTNGYFQGLIVANGGKIAGWTIGDEYITTNSERTTYNSESKTGMTMTSSGIGAYASSSAKFTLSTAGVLTATGANITGVINADTGRIGGSSGWTIASQQISSGTLGSDNSMYLATKNLGSNTSIAGRQGSDWRFTVGSKFGVTNTGAIYAASGKIASWDIESNDIKTGIWGSENSAMLCTGSVSSKSIGGSGSISGWVFTAGANFGVTKTGALYANSANITGALTATSLTINSGASISGDGASQILNSEIDIGGRNVVHDTGTWSNWSCTDNVVISDGVMTATNTTTGTFKRANGWFTLAKSDIYSKDIVISFDVKKSDSVSLRSCCVQLFTTNKAYKSQASGNITEGSRIYGALSGSIWQNTAGINSSEWTRVYSAPIKMSEKFDTSHTEYNYLALYVGISSTSVGSVSYRNLKIELGTKPTDWSPAPEDLEAYADTAVSNFGSRFTVTPENISSEVTALANGSEIASRINQTANTVKIAASKVEIDGAAVFNAISSSVQSTVDNTVEQINKETISRGEQLVTNGNGMMGDNTNFSQLTFDGSNSNYSPGSFTRTGNYAYVGSNDYFPIDANKRYRFEMDVKSRSNLSTMYSFIIFYDVDKYAITADYHMYRANTLTTLARELKAGDTVVYLTSVANYTTLGTGNHQRALIFWDYKNSFGYQYPPETYSRNILMPAWTDNNSINSTNNTITLASAYTGKTHPAGTYVSQGLSGGNYKYTPLSNHKIPTTWTHYTGYYDGVDLSGTNVTTKIPPGTAYGRVGFLWNYNSANDQIWVTNIQFYEDYKTDIAKALNKHSIHTLNSSYSQTYSTLIGWTAEGVNSTWTVASTTGVEVGDTVRIKCTVSDMSNTPVYAIGTVTAINSSTSLKMTSHGIDTTVIDGGKILTGTITADQIQGNTLTLGKFTSSDQNSILNSNIEIGGRNLYISSTAVDGYLHSNGTSITAMSSAKEQTSDFISVDGISTLTLQCWTPDLTSSDQTWLAYAFYSAKNMSNVIGSRTAKYSTSGVKYLSYVDIPVVSGAKYIRVSYKKKENGYVKVETGNKATDWTPAPEDIDVNKYITEISQDGIWVTPSNKKPTNASTGAGATGTKIDGDGVGIYNSGTKLAEYGSVTKFYDGTGTSTSNVAAQIGADGLDVIKGHIGNWNIENGDITYTADVNDTAPTMSLTKYNSSSLRSVALIDADTSTETNPNSGARMSVFYESYDSNTSTWKRDYAGCYIIPNKISLLSLQGRSLIQPNSLSVGGSTPNATIESVSTGGGAVIQANSSSSEADVKAMSGSGTIYLFSSNNGNRGVYGTNSSNTGHSIIDVTNTNASYFRGQATSVSDLKKKDVITDYDWKIDEFINGLKPIAFRRIHEDGTLGDRIRMGFGAQDIRDLTRLLYKEELSLYQAKLIDDTKDGTEKESFDYHGEEIDDKKLSWSLAYEELIAPMVLEIQRLMARVDKLETDLKKYQNGSDI